MDKHIKKLFTLKEKKGDINKTREYLLKDEDGIKTSLSELYYEYWNGRLQETIADELHKVIDKYKLDIGYLLKGYDLTEEMAIEMDLMIIDGKILCDIMPNAETSLNMAWFQIPELPATLRTEGELIPNEKYTPYTILISEPGLKWKAHFKSRSFGKNIKPITNKGNFIGLLK